MAVTSSGKNIRPFKVVKSGTLSTRKHRFESFNQRIAKLKIDPVRRGKRQDVDSESTSSFFKTGLEHWRETNLSESFTSFVREVDPLCNSLAQLLHYEERVIDTLVKYIERHDALSLEPLLSLMSHLAHDLGQRFERHFARAVKLIVSLAANHSDVEVIEWGFTCLAWLFKYLSRLLVPDLRPVYDIISPFLGKEVQKVHTTKFAADAMSFLIRRAAVLFERDSDPLKRIIQHIYQDLSDFQKENAQLYQFGIMTLYAEAIKGIDRGIHSCGAKIYQSLLEHLTSPSTNCCSVLLGLTTNLIHYTDAVSFSPIQNIAIEYVKSDTATASSLMTFQGELLFTVVAVRKGSRVQDWKGLLEAVLAMLRRSSDVEGFEPALCGNLSSILKATAVTLQVSPLDLAIPKFQAAMAIIAGEKYQSEFLPFCVYFSELGKDRFQSLLAPYFFKYYVACLPVWSILIASIDLLLQNGRTTSLECVAQFRYYFNQMMTWIFNQ